MCDYAAVLYRLLTSTKPRCMISKSIHKSMRNWKRPANLLGWIWRPMKMSTALKCTCHTLQKLWKSKFRNASFALQSTHKTIHSFVLYLLFTCSFRNQFTIVPILVGSISPDVEATYGELLAPYLADPQNLFVISSDFCHWGKRFSYTYYEDSCGPIHKSIEKLDKNVSHQTLYWNWNLKPNDCLTKNVFTGNGFNRNVGAISIYRVLEAIQ